MKIITKMPEFNPERHSELIKNNWILLNEPGNICSAIILSFPLMILNTLVTLGVLSIFVTLSSMLFDIGNDGLSISVDLKHIIGLIILLLLHEALHFVCIPGFSKSGCTFFGLTPVGGFVYSEESISKLRYICITLTPFLILSVIVPLLCGLFNLLTQYLIILILLNSMASSVDILNLILVAIQVPKGSQITSNGFKTYWKTL